MGAVTRLITVAMRVRVGWAAEVSAVAVTSAEMSELHRWMAAKFDGTGHTSQLIDSRAFSIQPSAWRKSPGVRGTPGQANSKS
jgi:hypothetical protein